MKVKKRRLEQLFGVPNFLTYISMSIIFLNLDTPIFAQPSIENPKATKVNASQNPPQIKGGDQKKTINDRSTQPNATQPNATQPNATQPNATQSTSTKNNPVHSNEAQVNPNPRDEIKNKSNIENDSKMNHPVHHVKNGLEIGGRLAELSFSGEEGGRTDGSPWSSRELAGKAWSIWYVDPDVRDLNFEAQEAFKSQRFPEDKIASVAMINMAATAVPNFILGQHIAKSQQDYKKTIYVKDYKRKGIKIWGMKDDSSCVLVLDPDGKVVFYHCGKLNTQDIEKMIEATKKMLGLIP